MVLLNYINAPYGIPCSRDCRRTGRTKTRTTDSTIPFCFLRQKKRLIIILSLTSIGLDLLGGTLGTLLADLSALALGSLSGELGLLSLLGGGGRGLLVLAILDGLSSGGGASLGADVALLLDHIERCTDNASLGLDGSAGSLLGNLL